MQELIGDLYDELDNRLKLCFAKYEKYSVLPPIDVATYLFLLLKLQEKITKAYLYEKMNNRIFNLIFDIFNREMEKSYSLGMHSLPQIDQIMDDLFYCQFTINGKKLSEYRLNNRLTGYYL